LHYNSTFIQNFKKRKTNTAESVASLPPSIKVKKTLSVHKTICCLSFFFFNSVNLLFVAFFWSRNMQKRSKHHKSKSRHLRQGFYQPQLPNPPKNGATSGMIFLIQTWNSVLHVHNWATHVASQPSMVMAQLKIICSTVNSTNMQRDSIQHLNWEMWKRKMILLFLEW